MTNQELEYFIKHTFNVDEEDVTDKYQTVITDCIYFNNDEFAILQKSRKDEGYIEKVSRQELIDKINEIIEDIEDDDFQKEVRGLFNKHLNNTTHN